MRMASKRKLSGAESRKSKWQRELLRSAEATESITTYFARTACSAVSTSEGSLACSESALRLIAFLYT